MMDQELFDLCSEVYKRTGWKDTLDYLWMKESGEIDSQRASRISVKGGWWYVEYIEGTVPLYSTEYLLAKLPMMIGDYRLTVQPVIYPSWCASYDTRDDDVYTSFSDTPLKALLKLVITLDDAGELPR